MERLDGLFVHVELRNVNEDAVVPSVLVVEIPCVYCISIQVLVHVFRCSFYCSCSHIPNSLSGLVMIEVEIGAALQEAVNTDDPP